MWSSILSVSVGLLFSVRVPAIFVCCLAVLQSIKQRWQTQSGFGSGFQRRNWVGMTVLEEKTVDMGNTNLRSVEDVEIVWGAV